MDHIDDAAIIDGLSRGDQKAFRELVERYKKKVFYLALDMAGNPVDAEDISQEVFLKVFRSFSTFRRDANLGSWLYRITYNASIDHLRRKGAAPQPVGDEVLESLSRVEAGLPPRGAAEPGAGLEASQLQERIARALETISPQEKAVFVLRHYEDLKLKEIAATLDLSIGSVKSYLFRAVRKLQKELGTPALASGTESSHE
ncbi:MAG TPA: sigma-70 family RNA polymerase sigma factor [Candidatus Aminicenantes bacterium]|nr:sigma-70 family RNA polymerase sigma factor [Candidatus Aminicenantes bacterium]HRY66206.1 sigma-70 family RNA polymerase sigma factor [Candidatus Aminicenantes bacterium]HRZ73120.1 sigma-70 family RNA polymerase sigma factor [Candidatus Aminicenantes bacterium]